MDRGKIVAIITGALSILLAFAYLIIVQILDFRGEMKPAPISQVGIENVKFIHKDSRITVLGLTQDFIKKEDLGGAKIF